MKKIFLSFLAVSFVLSFTACNQSSSSKSSGGGSAAVDADPEVFNEPIDTTGPKLTSEQKAGVGRLLSNMTAINTETIYAETKGEQPRIKNLTARERGFADEVKRDCTVVSPEEPRNQLNYSLTKTISGPKCPVDVKSVAHASIVFTSETSYSADFIFEIKHKYISEKFKKELLISDMDINFTGHMTGVLEGSLIKKRATSKGHFTITLIDGRKIAVDLIANDTTRAKNQSETTVESSKRYQKMIFKWENNRVVLQTYIEHGKAFRAYINGDDVSTDQNIIRFTSTMSDN